jgi:hypothetical protein
MGKLNSIVAYSKKEVYITQF